MTHNLKVIAIGLSLAVDQIIIFENIMSSTNYYDIFEVFIFNDNVSV